MLLAITITENHEKSTLVGLGPCAVSFPVACSCGREGEGGAQRKERKGSAHGGVQVQTGGNERSNT